MKFGLLVLQSLAMMATATSAKILSSNNMRSLMSQARRLEEEEVLSAEVEDYMMHYSVKLLSCSGDEQFEYNSANGDEYIQQSGVVVFRLCPSDSCSDTNGCKSGYADFAVSLGSFVEAFVEDQMDNMQWDDGQNQMDAENYAQCSEYEAENNQNGATYYVGPACTEDELGVKLDLFEDQYCSQKSTSSFSDISNGWTLPFSDGGLVSASCIECGEENEYGEKDLKEMCMDLYEEAPYKCEMDWDVQHYYWDAITEIYRFGNDQTGCRLITALDKTEKPFDEWASVFLLSILIIVSVGGSVFYTIWWRKQKLNLEKIDDDDEDEDDDDEDGDKNDYHAAEDQPEGQFA